MEQQKLVMCGVNRNVALIIGKAMLDMGMGYIALNESLLIPDLNLSVKIPPLDSTEPLDLTMLPSEATEWPEFHLGVQSGLKVAVNNPNINVSWVFFNRPENLDAKHAGLMFSMGLSGKLKDMLSWQIYSYLQQKHDLCTLSLLLGLGISFRGTMDGSVTRLLSVHIPALLPPSSCELNISPNVQTTSIFALGLTYLKTCNRRMSELMLAEIGNAQLETSNLEVEQREGYCLTAGFALGLINLSQGQSAHGLSDMSLVDVLRRYIHAVPSLSGKPVINATLMSPDRKVPDIIASGSMVALALMYMKTNHSLVSDLMKLPTTDYELNYIRPDLLLVKTICHYLIQWDLIHPSKQWIESTVPEFIKKRQDLLIYHESIIAGACFVIGLKYAGSFNQMAFTVLLEQVDQFTKTTNIPGNSINCNG
jgi:anaphase-promoting complex subunit 1